VVNPTVHRAARSSHDPLTAALDQEHEYKVWGARDVKLRASKILMTSVVSHATDLVEHPERLANRIITFPEIVG